jgi:flagellar hook-basal body complex protein FliE
MLRRLSLVPFAALLCSLSFSIACATPPTREMDQAQGAIDAARAAGADRFATEQYGAAVKALQSAQEAVGQRDYRLALNYALDSRDRAQRAAKEAASQQAVLRSASERRLSEVTALLDRAEQQLKTADAARLPRRATTAPRAAIADAEASLQKAGTSIQEGNYTVSQEQLAESAAKLKSAMAEIDTAMKARGKRK